MWHSSNEAPFLSVGMTDEEVVRRFHEVVGVGRVHGPYAPKGPKAQQPQWKMCFMWRLSNHHDVNMVMDRFSPWLGARRKECWAEMLTKYAASTKVRRPQAARTRLHHKVA